MFVSYPERDSCRKQRAQATGAGVRPPAGYGVKVTRLYFVRSIQVLVHTCNLGFYFYATNTTTVTSSDENF